MNILHFAFTDKFQEELKYILNLYDIELKYHQFEDNTFGKYNIGEERAINYWNKFKNIFNTFDLIIITDTSPLLRVLVNNFKKPIIVWMNNRIDYYDSATNDCKFPDDNYYKLLKADNIIFLSMSNFDKFYCNKIKKLYLDITLCRPIGVQETYLKATNNELYTFYLSQTHNELKVLNLNNILDDNKINYINTYKQNLRGIIHLPFEWCSYDMYQKLKNNDIMFIPSKDFIIDIYENDNYHWQAPFDITNLEISEWYSDDFKDCFVYFNSWKDLKIKTLTTNYKKKKELIKNVVEKLEKDSLKVWYNFLST